MPGFVPDHPHAGGENADCIGGLACHLGPSPRGWGKLGGPVSAGKRYRTIPTRVGKTPRCGRCRPWSPDHPHAGGENDPGVWQAIRSIGPSPRGWGKLVVPGVFAAIRRTIPTRVGKTATQPVLPVPDSDHPHAGGENQPEGLNVAECCGPSPRGWGKRPDIYRAVVELRTIPTRVGKTRDQLPPQTGCADHPHAGGENAALVIGGAQLYGPSPRGWGKPDAYAARWRVCRTIPTRVGKT